MKKLLWLAALSTAISGCSSNNINEGKALKNNAPPTPNGIVCSQFFGKDANITETSNSSIFIKSANKLTTISLQLVMPKNENEAIVYVSKMINNEQEAEEIFELARLEKPKNHIILSILYLNNDSMVFYWSADNQTDKASMKFEGFTPGSWEQFLVNLEPQFNDCKNAQ